MKAEEIIRLMDVAKENLTSAEILLQNGLYRDAITRVYYSMYHAAKAVLLIRDIFTWRSCKPKP